MEAFNVEDIALAARDPGTRRQFLDSLLAVLCGGDDVGDGAAQYQGQARGDASHVMDVESQEQCVGAQGDRVTKGMVRTALDGLDPATSGTSLKRPAEQLVTEDLQEGRGREDGRWSGRALNNVGQEMVIRVVRENLELRAQVEELRKLVDRSLRKCGECQRFVPREQFSIKQRRRAQFAKCRECVEASVTETGVQSSSERLHAVLAGGELPRDSSPIGKGDREFLRRLASCFTMDEVIAEERLLMVRLNGGLSDGCVEYGSIQMPQWYVKHIKRRHRFVVMLERWMRFSGFPPPSYRRQEWEEASSQLVEQMVVHGLVGISHIGPVWGTLSQQQRAKEWGISRGAEARLRAAAAAGEVGSDEEGDFSAGESDAEGEEEEKSMEQFLRENGFVEGEWDVSGDY